MWAQAFNMVIGLWLMAAPAVLGYGRPMSTSDHIVGPLVATFACIALWEATRSARWVNLPLGLWIALAPWPLGAPAAGIVNGLVCGMAIAAISCRRGAMKHEFGGGWAVLW
jgi:hypothetical protein